jgi:hypothetical protein
MKEKKARWHSPSLSACSAPTAETIASASAAALSSVKRSSKQMEAALKPCTISGAGGDWASGGEWITVTRGRGWEEASEVPVPVAVLFVDGLVLVLVLVRRMRAVPSNWARGRTKRAVMHVMPHSRRGVVPSCWTSQNRGLAIDELKRRMGASAWSLGIGKVKRAEGRSISGSRANITCSAHLRLLTSTNNNVASGSTTPKSKGSPIVWLPVRTR